MIKCLDCERPATVFIAAKLSDIDLLWALCDKHAKAMTMYRDPDRRVLTKDEYLTAKLKRAL